MTDIYRGTLKQRLLSRRHRHIRHDALAWPVVEIQLVAGRHQVRNLNNLENDNKMANLYIWDVLELPYAWVRIIKISNVRFQSEYRTVILSSLLTW